MRSVFRSRWRTAVLVAACLALIVAFAVRPRAAGSISQNFDGIGTAAAAVLPTDFRVDKQSAVRTVGSYATAGTVTANRGGNNLSTSAGNGIYNFGAGDPATATDRAVGFLSSGSGTASGNLYLRLKNTSGAPVTGVPISYNVEKYRGGTNTAGFRILLYYSFNGSTWTSAGAPFLTYFPGDANNNGYASAPGTTVPVAGTLGVTVPDGSDLYLAWNYSVSTASTTTNAQALAIDDIDIGGVGSTSPFGSGAASPPNVAAGASSLLTVTVTGGSNPGSTGLAVTADLVAIGGSPAQAFVDNGSNGDLAAADNIFSYEATVPAGTAAGTKSLPVTITDAQGRTGSTSISLTIDAPLVAIHDIQGSGDSSPVVGQQVATTGIVTGVNTTSGFFIQAPDTDVDNDPATSEGLFVYTGKNNIPNGAVVGNLVRLSGTVQEYGSQTEISGVSTVTVLSTGNTLPVAVPLTPANADPQKGTILAERFEGMRVEVAALTVVAPTDYGTFYGVFPGVARPFREPGLDPIASALPGMPAGAPRFDGNPERLAVAGTALGSFAVEVTTGATVSDVIGPLEYSSGCFTIDVDHAPTFTGNISAVAVPAAGAGQFTVASWNMLNFTNDVTRLSKASLVIRDILHMPDILGVEEVDNQATLQALADRVNVDAGCVTPCYAAYLLAPAGSGSQNLGLLTKSSVTVNDVTEVGRDATFIDPRDGSVDPLNDRPPLVLRGSVADPRGGPGFPVTVVVNHSRSMIDLDANSGPGLYARTKRRLGAEYLALLLQQHQANGEHVVSVGDYNAYQFNDGYVDVIGTILGNPTPADQVLLASPDLVEPNFTDLIDMAPADQRYSYTENGNAQTIDHVLISSNMISRVAHGARDTSLAFGRIDADFPYNFGSNPGPERTSDHDPVVAYFTFPTADLSVGASATPSNPVFSGSTITYTIDAANDADDDAMVPAITTTLPPGLNDVKVTTVQDGWNCDILPGTDSTKVTCTAGSFKAHSGATFAIEATADCLLPDSELKAVVTIDAATYDPNDHNNGQTVTTTISNPEPTISAETASPATLWPVNHKFVQVTIDYSVADNCGPVPVCSITNVKSSEPTDGKGDGRNATDWQVAGAHKVLLRAERSGTGNGRTYTVTVSCTDVGGNTGTKDVVVTVPKSQGNPK